MVGCEYDDEAVACTRPHFGHTAAVEPGKTETTAGAG